MTKYAYYFSKNKNKISIFVAIFEKTRKQNYQCQMIIKLVSRTTSWKNKNLNTSTSANYNFTKQAHTA